MRELSNQELEIVSGGMRLQGQRGSMNIVDMRSGYAHTPFLSPRLYVPNPIENYRHTGRFLPNRWSDLSISFDWR